MKSTFLHFFIFLSIITQAQTSLQYEFRGVWVATVLNIDWPSEKGLSVEQQKQEFIQLADMHQRNGMNALIVQIRPAADAFYPSKYEPWSEYLTGQQGLAPSPEYDPLQFMIEEAHKRGMEFHAWLNPYRAVFSIANSSISPFHISALRPDWFMIYGDKKYFNPGVRQVRNHVAAVVKDIVSRYDIDAIHIDDYFYPYRIKGQEFPDDETYRLSGTTLSKDDWRRSNCDSIVKQIYQTIKSVKPYVKFGVSPFGVWRNADKDPEGSNTKAGQTCYDDLYADILLWLKKGWIDYVVPQLYWENGHQLCDYSTLLKWWNEHTYERHLYIGLQLNKVGSETLYKNKDEFLNEIKKSRNYSTTHGCIFFSSKNFNNNPNGWCDSLQQNYYSLPAIVPPMKWIDNVAPEKPIVKKIEKNIFNIEYNGTKKLKGFAVYTLPEKAEVKRIHATLIKIINLDSAATINLDDINAASTNKIFISSLDRNNNVSEWVELK